MTSTVASIRRQIALVTDAVAGSDAMRRLIVETTRRETARIEAEQGVLPKTLYVDGRKGAPLESVRPDGATETHFHALQIPVDWVYAEWVRQSPVGPPEGGHYRDDIDLFVDGVRRDAAEGGTVDVSQAREVVIVSLRPYARKLARGLSVQAPEGWIELIAREAKRRFGDMARIDFDYRTFGAPVSRRTAEVMTGRQRAQSRYPAIVIESYR